MAIDAKIRSIIKDLGHIKIDDMMMEVSSINPSSYYRSKTSIGADGEVHWPWDGHYKASSSRLMRRSWDHYDVS